MLYAVKLNSSSVSVEQKKIYRVVSSAQTQSSTKKILQTYVNNFTSRASGIWTTTMINFFSLSLTHSSTHRSIRCCCEDYKWELNFIREVEWDVYEKGMSEMETFKVFWREKRSTRKYILWMWWLCIPVCVSRVWT